MASASNNSVSFGITPATGASTGTWSLGPKCCRWSVMALSLTPGAADGRVHDDSDDDQGADKHVEVEAGRPSQQQHVLDSEHERRAKHDAEDRAASASQCRSADHARRDRLQLHAE